MLYKELDEDSKNEFLESISNSTDDDFFQWLELKRDLDDLFADSEFCAEFDKEHSHSC